MCAGSDVRGSVSVSPRSKKKQARAGGVLLRGLAVPVVFLSVPAAGRGCAWDSSDYEVEIVRRVCGYIGSFGFLGYAVHFY